LGFDAPAVCVLQSSSISRLEIGQESLVVPEVCFYTAAARDGRLFAFDGGVVDAGRRLFTAGASKLPCPPSSSRPIPNQTIAQSRHMLPACAWLARRAAARASAPAAAAIAPAACWPLLVAGGGQQEGAPCSRSRDDKGSRAASSTPVAAATWALRRTAARARPPQHQQARWFGGDGEAEQQHAAEAAAVAAAAAAAAASASLQAELAALNRELADVFGEPAPDGPAGGGMGGMRSSGSSSSSSSTRFAPRPPTPPPPPPPPPPPASTPSAAAAPPTAADARLSHVDARTGLASMVDVSHKPPTLREARASCRVRLSRRASSAVAANALKKGDVLGACRLAGIMGAKRASDLIPLCHPLLLTRVDVTAELVDEEEEETGGARAEEQEEEQGEEEGERGREAGGGGENTANGGGGGEGLGRRPRAVLVACAARVGAGSTGVEMEALAGASVAALTVYDMVKAVGKGCAVISDLRLDYKVGGKGGAWARKGLERDDPAGWARMAAAGGVGGGVGVSGGGVGGGVGGALRRGEGEARREDGR